MKRIEKICRQCGDHYWVLPWRADSQFCSQECYFIWMRGRPKDAP